MFKKIRASVFGLAAAAVILFALALTIDRFSRFHTYRAAKPLRDLKSIPIRDISGIPCSRDLHVKFIDENSLAFDEAVRYRIEQKPTNAVFMNLLYDKNRETFLIRIFWKNPTFWGGKFPCYYILTSTEDIRFLRDFIDDHEILLQSIESSHNEATPGGGDKSRR